MRRPLFLLFFLAARLSIAQTWEYVYRDPKDSTLNCYLKFTPASGTVNGLIVRDYSALPDTAKASPFRLQQLAAEKGIMTLYTVTSGFFPEMYYDDSSPALLDEIIREVMTMHRIPAQNLFIGGMSASGTRALRYAQYCEQGKSKYGHKVAGVFAADPPLDLERFYNSAKNNAGNFKKGMLEEAGLILKAFPEKLGGTPQEKPERYRQASVYSRADSSGGNARLLAKVPVILFHEPDMEWWTEERGATFFDINSYDITGFAGKLKALGSEKIEVVTTTGKGFDRQGNRNCHSWTIVDEEYLVKWILNQLR